MAELTDLERMLIEHACTRLVNAYAQALDRGDYEALAAMYAEDAVFARPTMPTDRVPGRTEIVARLQARPPATIRHVMADIVVDAVSPTEATGECYIVMFRGPAPGESGDLPPMNPVPLVGAFNDRFVRVDGRWVFKERLGSLAYLM